MTSAMLQGGVARSDSEPISEIDILWLTAGLSCDGDTIAVTAATQPSIEDLVLGMFPWIPKVNFHNPFLAYENGDEFVRYFRDAAEGKLSPFILVVEGSIPNEKNKEEGYWATFGANATTGQPITTCDWIDQLAPKAWAVVAAGAAVTLDGAVIAAARVGLTAVNPDPAALAELSAALVGQPATDEVFADAGGRAAQACDPATDIRGTAEYKRHLASELTIRTLRSAAQRVSNAAAPEGN